MTDARILKAQLVSNRRLLILNNWKRSEDGLDFINAAKEVRSCRYNRGQIHMTIDLG